MHDCESHLERLNETCVVVLTDFNKTLDEKDIATQDLYHLTGRLEDKKIKFTMLENDFLLDKYDRLLSETQLEIDFNQQDLARKEIVHINRLIEKLFKESKAIENLVNNGMVDKTYN